MWDYISQLRNDKPHQGHCIMCFMYAASEKKVVCIFVYLFDTLTKTYNGFMPMDDYESITEIAWLLHNFFFN